MCHRVCPSLAHSSQSGSPLRKRIVVGQEIFESREHDLMMNERKTKWLISLHDEATIDPCFRPWLGSSAASALQLLDRHPR